MKSNRAAPSPPLSSRLSPPSLLASSFLYPPSFLGLDFLSAPFFFPLFLSPSFLFLYFSLPLFSSLFSSATPRPVSTLSYPLYSHPLRPSILEIEGKRRDKERERERGEETHANPFLHEEEIGESAESSSLFHPLPQFLDESYPPPPFPSRC